jgi:hypothetical protein
MGFFDKKIDKQVEYLEKERQKIWDRLLIAEGALTELSKIPENSARQQLRETTKLKGKAETRLKEIEELALKVKRESDAATANAQTLDQHRASIIKTKDEVEGHAKLLADRSNELEARVEALDQLTIDHPELAEEIETLETELTTISQSSDRIQQLLKASTTARSTIQKEYEEIFGFETENEDGETIKTPGLKDQLSKAFNKLDSKIQLLETELQAKKTKAIEIAAEAAKETKKSFEDQKTESSKQLEAAVSTRKSELDLLTTEIRNLLPAALTVGLSAAYAEKRTREKEERKEHVKAFEKGVKLLIGVSIIPFIVSIGFLIDGQNLEDIILKLPRLVLSILPLYLPALWITGAAAKRIKLSKRLIEEYAHKETQSRTFEGLASQVNSLGDDEQSLDLKRRLLYNLIQISSENPGKLISDYNSTDHPVTELVDSMERTNMLAERVGNFPLIGKAIKLVQKNQTKQAQRINEEVAETFSSTAQKADELISAKTNEADNNNESNIT